MSVVRLSLERYRRVVVLTGAGVSVASGLRPYRGPGGVWDEYQVAEYGRARALTAHPEKVWQLFGHLRAQLPHAEPNEGHRSIARAQAFLEARGASFLLITQNVDGLHQRAGSRHVAELHGNISRSRCSNPSCREQPFLDADTHLQTLPRCRACGCALRPDIVLFDEAVDPAALWRAKRALRDADLFLAIGTSGLVAPASSFVRTAQYAGAHSVYINIEPLSSNPGFTESVIGPAEKTLGELLCV